MSVVNRRTLRMQAKGTSEDEQGKEILSSGTIIAGFFEVTTSHGISHIHQAKGSIKKSIWTLLSLASLTSLILHLIYLITGYISFDVLTNVAVVESRSMDFPAVTVCNSNGLKSSNIPAQLLEIITSRMEGLLNGTQTTRSNTATYKRLSEEIALLNEAEKELLGYSQADMFIYCTYNSENCAGTFWRHFDSTYGNCYTFNSGKFGVAKSSLAGASNGLTLTINIGEYDYLPFLTEDAGIRVVIHDQDAMPFPDRDGITASPGQISNIALKKIVTTRKSGKYGNCTTATQNNENMYHLPYNVSYTQWACLQTCYQKELVNLCRCFHPDLPYDSSSPVFNGLPSASGPCRLNNVIQTNCTITVKENFADRSLPCAKCFQPCVESTFESSLSTSLYPAISYISDFINLLNATHGSLMTSLTNIYGKNQIATGIRANFLKINVYYQSMTYMTYTEVASYGDYQFVSDLGGAFGLWIGWSALTLFEIFEFAIDLLTYVCCRCSVNKHS
ncbi:FMRFamide-activated amiloride-sensitive sodium channel-like [Watersipora subatra]|uniref:FMRFamide-activated amiloride-sensitive sodium channel-like n=1 Tax=Watersipora subatra TaxID=2589382 RepID=UPI00355B9B43